MLTMENISAKNTASDCQVYLYYKCTKYCIRIQPNSDERIWISAFQILSCKLFTHTSEHWCQHWYMFA